MRADSRFEAIHSTFHNSTVIKSNSIYQCDLAVIQGWKKSSSADSPHNEFRQKIIDHQLSSGNHVLTVDGNIFNYKSKNVFFRYSIDGIFANTGYYFDDEVDPKRWERIKETSMCELKPWRKNGRHVLVLLQKDSGWTMETISNLDLLKNTINTIRKYTDRKIVVRVHPSDAAKMPKYTDVCNDLCVDLSKTNHILYDLDNAWCSITFNSSPGAVSVIEGIPTFIMDPNWKRSPAADVGNININNIEDPMMPERQSWIERVSMSHFSVEDIQDGLLWNKTLQYFDKLGKI
jgi:hypothetical protein